jgi:hypothetical protein
LIAIGVVLYKNWDKIKAKALEIKASLIATWNSIKASISATINNLKTAMANAWNSIKATASSVWNGIKTAITSPITSARDKVKAIIDKLKGYFPLKVGNLLSGIKLPHFKISGSFSIKNKTVPSISIDWYKTGGIFDGPQVIGVGEAGPEAVVPLDKFWDKLDNMTTGETNIVINVNGAGDPKAVADEVKRILIQETNRRRLAWQ